MENCPAQSLSRMTTVLLSASEVLSDLASVSCSPRRHQGNEDDLYESLELLVLQLNYELEGWRTRDRKLK